MHTASEAIVLQRYPYKDKSAVVKLYTMQLGLVSCWVNSVHGKKSKTKSAILQPFSVINAEILHNETNALYRLKEISMAASTQNIHTNIEKTTIAIFISELLSHCIKESSTDHSLYKFIKGVIMLLDNTGELCKNFHLVFMVRLCEHLGFLPAGNYSGSTPYFNLTESIFQKVPPFHPNYLDNEKGKLFSELIALPMDKFFTISVTAQMRKSLVASLLEYYIIHTGMSPLKSHYVFEDL